MSGVAPAALVGTEASVGIVDIDLDGARRYVFDSQLPMAQDSLIKVFGWYDNEWGYSCRLVDLVGRIG